MRVSVLLGLALASLAAPLAAHAQVNFAEVDLAAADSALNRSDYPAVLAQTASALTVRDLPASDVDRARLLRAKAYLALGDEVRAHGEASKALVAASGDVEAQAIERRTRVAAMKAYAEVRRRVDASIPPPGTPIPKPVIPPASSCAGDPRDYNETGCRTEATPHP